MRSKREGRRNWGETSTWNSMMFIERVCVLKKCLYNCNGIFLGKRVVHLENDRPKMIEKHVILQIYGPIRYHRRFLHALVGTVQSTANVRILPSSQLAGRVCICHIKIITVNLRNLLFLRLWDLSRENVLIGWGRRSETSPNIALVIFPHRMLIFKYHRAQNVNFMWPIQGIDYIRTRERNQQRCSLSSQWREKHTITFLAQGGNI